MEAFTTRRASDADIPPAKEVPKKAMPKQPPPKQGVPIGLARKIIMAYLNFIVFSSGILPMRDYEVNLFKTADLGAARNCSVVAMDHPSPPYR